MKKPSLCVHDPANGDKEPSSRRMRFERGDPSSPLFLRDSDSPSPSSSGRCNKVLFEFGPLSRTSAMRGFKVHGCLSCSQGWKWVMAPQERKIWKWQGKRYNWYAEQEYAKENLNLKMISQTNFWRKWELCLPMSNSSPWCSGALFAMELFEVVVWPVCSVWVLGCC